MIDSGEPGFELSGGNRAYRPVIDFHSSLRNLESLSANPAGAAVVESLPTAISIIQVFSESVGRSSIGQHVGSIASLHSHSTSSVVGGAFCVSNVHSSKDFHTLCHFFNAGNLCVFLVLLSAASVSWVNPCLSAPVS